jgi:hypothetical protein
MKEWEMDQWLEKLSEMLGDLPNSDASDLLLTLLLEHAAAMFSQRDGRAYDSQDFGDIKEDIWRILEARIES